MSPKEYVTSYRTTSPLKAMLTPQQQLDAQEVADAGFRFIARKVGDQFEDMTPEAVKSIESLTLMLGVFIEHATNPGLLRRAIAAAG